MKLLFLRGQVPKDRNPKEIIFDAINKNDDWWTQLAYHLLDKEDYGEIWYWGGSRKQRFDYNFIERWIPDFNTYNSKFIPDVIFCRGGFKEYITVLNRYPNAYKIYYGAGKRFLPSGYINYNLILQDSPEQLEECRKFFPNIKSTLFIKSAPDNIFNIDNSINKEYDVCFPANGTQSFKGHDFVYSSVPKDLKVLNLGLPSNIKKPKNVISKRVLRKDISKEIQKCKVGIVCCRHEPDSCPRVIPEMLASNIPIIVLKDVRFWKDIYINKITGKLASKKDFWKVVKEVLDNIDNYKPRQYYDSNLSLKNSSRYIKNILSYKEKRNESK